ncbi:FmdB family zinc ribbon protein [Nocardioides marmoraquaticus]
MPTYQYSCTQCGHFMEVVQSFTDDSLTVCPECEGRLRKVFGAVGVVFKGSGFYRTDSRTADSSSTGSESSGSKDAAPKQDAAPKKETAATKDSSSSSSSSTPKSA